MTILLREEINPIYGFIKSLNGLGVLDSLKVVVVSLKALIRIVGIFLMVDQSRSLIIYNRLSSTALLEGLIFCSKHQS